MISAQLEQILNKAIKTANEKRHEFLTIENVLYALLSDEVVNKVLTECHVNMEVLEKDLKEFLENDAHFSILTEEEIEELGKQQFSNEELREIARQNGIRYQPEISLSLQRVIQRAALHVQSS